jgi:hypothetical protein
MSDGRFACGRVLQLGGEENPTPARAFFGGLHSWAGAAPPDADTDLGSQFIQYGLMHIRAILESGGAILGLRPLVADRVEIPQLLSAVGGPGTKILRGATHVRDASPNEWGTLPVLGSWGADFIVALANQHLAPKVA